MNSIFLASAAGDIETVLLGTIEDSTYEFPGQAVDSMIGELVGLDTLGDGILDDVTDLRDEVGADSAGFISADAESGVAGIAFLNGRSMIVGRPFATTAALTFEHEYGHNLGCRHAFWDNPGEAANPLNASNYGWRFSDTGGSNYRTIMSVNL